MSAAVHALRAVGADAAAARDRAAIPDAYARATRVVASIAVVGVGVDERIGLGATAALPLAIVLLPLWLPVMRRHALATLVLALAALSAVSGVVLGELSSVDHVVSGTNRIQEIGLLASGVAAFGLLAWAGTHLPVHRLALLYGAGALASTVAVGDLSWKYDLAVPTTLLVLGAIERRRASLLGAAAIVALGVAGVADEARSFFAVCVLAATLTVWQRRPTRSESGTGARHRWLTVTVLAGLGAAVYLFITALATGGTLGETLQQRSTTQVATSGSVIAGGRPEWAATRELLQLNPAGYGAGVVPNWSDRIAGETGLASINVDAGGYADNYMFGDSFQLHSVAADLWVRFGWVGVALGVAIVVVIVRDLSGLLADRRAPTFVTFACILALWYVLFGPMYSNWFDVCLALGLVTVAAQRPEAADIAERAAP